MLSRLVKVEIGNSQMHSEIFFDVEAWNCEFSDQKTLDYLRTHNFFVTDPSLMFITKKQQDPKSPNPNY